MEEERPSNWAQIIEIFHWLVEIFISWTAPGLIFVSAFFLLYPQYFFVPEFVTTLGDYKVLIFGFLWPTFLGLLINSIGICIFSIVAKFRDFENKLENSLNEQFAQAELATLENPFLSLTDEQIKILKQLSKEDQDELIKNYWAQRKADIVVDIKKRVNLGLSLTPHILFYPKIKKELRRHAIIPQAFHVFSLSCIGMIISLFIFSIVHALYLKNCEQIISISLFLFLVLLLFFPMALRFAQSYCVALYTAYIGIGSIASSSRTANVSSSIKRQ